MARVVKMAGPSELERRKIQEYLAPVKWLAAISEYRDGKPTALLRFLRGNVLPLTDSAETRSALADALEAVAPKPHHRQKYTTLQKAEARAQLETIDRLIDARLAQVRTLQTGESNGEPLNRGVLRETAAYRQMEIKDIRAEIFAERERLMADLSKRIGMPLSALKELRKSRSKKPR